MKKIRLELDALRVESFPTGTGRGAAGTVKAFSVDQAPTADCFSGVDTGGMCGCGESHSGQPGSCDDNSCIHGWCG